MANMANMANRNMGNRNTKDMTEGNPAKLILFFTLPLLAGNIFQQLYGFIDTLLVGRFLGVEALAAVGCTGSIMFLLVGCIMGLTAGLTIITGQRFGAKDFDGVRRSAAACIMLAMGASLITACIGTLFSRDILIWMDTPADILDGAESFITIVVGGSPLFCMFLVGANLLRALGDSRHPTMFLAASLCINILLEPLFLLVFEWGIPGAAQAMILSQVLGGLIAWTYIWRNVPQLRIRPEDLHLDWPFLWQHIRVGIPMAFQTSIIAIGAVILQIALNGLGPIAVASYSAAQKVETIAMMPMMSFGIAMAAYTAQNYGARKLSRIKKGVNQCILMSGTFSILVGIFNIFLGSKLMYLFVGPGETQVIEYGQTYLTTTGCCYWVLSLLFIYRNTLQGLGKSFVPTFAGIMELIMRAIVALGFVSTLGFWGATLASPAAWVGSCVPLSIAFYYTLRKMKREAREIIRSAENTGAR